MEPFNGEPWAVRSIVACLRPARCPLLRALAQSAPTAALGAERNEGTRRARFGFIGGSLLDSHIMGPECRADYREISLISV